MARERDSLRIRNSWVRGRPSERYSTGKVSPFSVYMKTKSYRLVRVEQVIPGMGFYMKTATNKVDFVPASKQLSLERDIILDKSESSDDSSADEDSEDSCDIM